MHGKFKNCTGGAAGYIDRIVFGSDHIYQHPTAQKWYFTEEPYDPEGKKLHALKIRLGLNFSVPTGLLGNLTAVLLVYFGVQAGRIMLTYSNPWSRLIRWIIWGILAVSDTWKSFTSRIQFFFNYRAWWGPFCVGFPRKTASFRWTRICTRWALCSSTHASTSFSWPCFTLLLTSNTFGQAVHFTSQVCFFNSFTSDWNLIKYMIQEWTRYWCTFCTVSPTTCSRGGGCRWATPMPRCCSWTLGRSRCGSSAPTTGSEGTSFSLYRWGNCRTLPYFLTFENSICFR